MQTSTCSISGVIAALASAEVQSFLRKLRSTLIVQPAALAALQAVATSFSGPSPSAGVMPVQWNQLAPPKTVGQSTSPGLIWLTALSARSYMTLLARGPAPLSRK